MSLLLFLGRSWGRWFEWGEKWKDGRVGIRESKERRTGLLSLLHKFTRSDLTWDDWDKTSTLVSRDCGAWSNLSPVTKGKKIHHGKGVPSGRGKLRGKEEQGPILQMWFPCGTDHQPLSGKGMVGEWNRQELTKKWWPREETLKIF